MHRSTRYPAAAIRHANFGETYDAHWSDIQVVTQSVPQPVTLLLLAFGVAGLGASSRMRGKAA